MKRIEFIFQLFLSLTVVIAFADGFTILGTLFDYGKALTWPKIKESFTEHPVQSPTDVDTRGALPMFLSAIEWHQQSDVVEKELELTNTGYYFEMALDPRVQRSDRPYLIGGPLFQNKYIFEQLHFHWGKDDLCGSEHSVDGARFSMEAHIVFYKQNYSSFEKAKHFPDGVAVISFFAQLDQKDNAQLNDMIGKLELIREPESKTTASFKEEFKFVDILFQQKDYISFPGSLTTPEYEECVTWIMFTNPFPISSRQINAFRQLKHKDGHSMIRENDRPLQEFGIRPIIYPMYKRTLELYSEEDSSEERYGSMKPRGKMENHPSFVARRDEVQPVAIAD